MREILFKAKRIDNGEWVIGNLVYSEDAEEGWEAIIIPTFDSGMFTEGDGKGDLGFEVWYRVDKDTICQYTGLTDKNGNKIWENDLIKCYYASGNEMAISQIVFSEGSLNLGWCKKDLKSLCIYNDSLLETGIKQRDAKECDVIGNIFDNPELLEV